MLPFADAESNRKVFKRKALGKGVNRLFTAAITSSKNCHRRHLSMFGTDGCRMDTCF